MIMLMKVMMMTMMLMYFMSTTSPECRCHFKEFTSSLLGLHLLTASLILNNLDSRHILKAFLILKSPPHQCGEVIILLQQDAMWNRFSNRFFKIMTWPKSLVMGLELSNLARIRKLDTAYNNYRA